ncbi:MAG: hypothetical protein ACP5JY_00260 [Candidatus Nanoarchaeia archaeon]
MVNMGLSTIKEVEKLINDTNRYLNKIGINLQPRYVEFSKSSDSSCYTPVSGLIELGEYTIPVLAHEAYHKHAYENVLTKDELSILNDVRDSLVEKIRTATKSKHNSVVTELKRRELGLSELTKNIGLISDNIYVVPCDESCRGCFSTRDEKFKLISIVFPVYRISNNGWEKVPSTSHLDPIHFAEFFTPEEKYFIERIGCPYKLISESDIKDRKLVDVIEKFASHEKKLAYRDEAVAYLIKAWLSGFDMNNYKDLMKYISDGIYLSGTYRFSRWGRGNGQEDKLAQAVVNEYKRLRNSGYNVEESIAKIVDINRFLQILESLDNEEDNEEF